MSQQQFDKLIKEKLAQQNYVPSDEGWTAIQQRIAANKPMPIAPIVSAKNIATTSTFSFATARKVAAVLLPLLAIWGTYSIVNNNNNASIQTNTHVAAIQNNANTEVQPNTNNVTAAAPAKELLVPGNTAVNQSSIKINSSDKTTTNNNFALHQNTNNTVKSIIDKFTEKQNPILPIETIANTKKPIITEDKIIENINNSNIEETPIVKQDIAIKQESKPIEKQYLPLELPNTKQKNKVNKNTGISMVAGAVVNGATYNSNGFNLGVAAEKSLSKRFYVDASIMVARNNPTWLQNQLADANPNIDASARSANGYTLNSADDGYVNSYGVNPSTDAFTAGNNNIPVDELGDDVSIANAAAYRLASTQIEAIPMIGYRIVPKLNIAGGADAVHIFQDASYKDGVNRLLLQSQSNPTLRSWDLGLVAKLEYKITKRIVVGYRHREGITSITTGTTKKRNYNGILVRVKVN
jgi:hypothetical protein